MGETTASTLDPGTTDAVRAGCRCPVIDNGYGRGYLGQPGVFVYVEGCPIHWTPVSASSARDQSRGGE